MFKVSITAMLNAFSAWWHMAGVLVIVGILIVVPDNHKSVGYVFGETINNTGFSGQTWSSFMFVYVFITGLAMAQYTITGFDASAHMSEETRKASLAAAWGMVMSVVVSVIFGFILLVAVTFAIPELTNDDLVGAGQGIVTLIWTESTSYGLGRIHALHRRRRADVLHDRLGDVGLADDVRVLARRRRPRTPALAARLQGRPRADLRRLGDLRPRRSLLMIPTLSNAFVGYAVGTQISVIGLYIAFILPVILRLKAGSSLPAGRLEPRPLLQAGRLGSDHLGRLHRDRVHAPVRVHRHPRERGLHLGLLQLHGPLVGGAFLLFGGWYVLSAHKWFKGPVVQGTEEELERIEAEFETPGSGVPPTPASQPISESMATEERGFAPRSLAF